jgi:N-acetylmuramoyl-L-alanine amidase CwlA
MNLIFDKILGLFVHPSIKKEEEPIEIKIAKPKYEYDHGRKFKKPPTWIVVHYTACPGVSAEGMCRAMRKKSTKSDEVDVSSSHFYIDEKNICSSVQEEYIAWHVCGGQCKQPDIYNKKSLEELSNYKASDWRYDLAASNHIKWKSLNDDFKGNSQSIGVDICTDKKSLSSRKATDTDWYAEPIAIENTAKTVAYLAKKYNILPDHIIRHGDATGKLCPRFMISIGEDSSGDVLWSEFKNKVIDYMTKDIIVSFV